MTTHKLLLSIDGGGIRGIIPVTAMVKLEQVTGRPARETFSFMAGTSTGAIISGALAAGIPAQRVLDLYSSRSAEIFPQRPWNILKRIFTGAMYSSLVLHDVIRQELRDARDWVLNDSPIDLLITAKRVTDGRPWYFVRDNPANSRRTGTLKLADCITASAAAPTYFYPFTINDQPPPPLDAVGELVDGGVGVAGNPVYQACVEAFYYTGGQYVPEDTTVVSLGTGRFAGSHDPRWIAPWVTWILGELLRSPGEQQTELVQRHFPQARFYRLDIMMDADIEMDNIGAIPQLREYGRRFADAIDWDAILSGTDEKFRVNEHKVHWQEYAMR